jgi:hypothetical protein
MYSNKWERYIYEGGEMPTMDWPELPMPDCVLVVDKQTGCMFVGSKLIHSQDCKCDEDERQDA